MVAWQTDAKALARWAAMSEPEASSASLIPLNAVPPKMIEQLLDRTFGEDRHARTAYRIREGMDWLEALSFAAVDEDDMLVGTIQCYPVGLMTKGEDGEVARVPLVMVGPVAVLPERQNEGFGQGLMAAMLDAESRMAAGGSPVFPQVLIGDQDYYVRWGFTASATGGWSCPGPYEKSRLLARGPALAQMPAKGMLGPW